MTHNQTTFFIFGIIALLFSISLLVTSLLDTDHPIFSEYPPEVVLMAQAIMLNISIALALATIAFFKLSTLF